jgi:hypothetical protein
MPNMSGVADDLDGLMPPRREVAVSPPSTLEIFEIVETSMQHLLLSLKLKDGFIGEICQICLSLPLLKR